MAHRRYTMFLKIVSLIGDDELSADEILSRWKNISNCTPRAQEISQTLRTYGKIYGYEGRYVKPEGCGYEIVLWKKPTDCTQEHTQNTKDKY